jgi:hypothetical protein
MPENTKPIKDENPQSAESVLDLQADGDGESAEVEAHGGCLSVVSVVEK